MYAVLCEGAPKPLLYSTQKVYVLRGYYGCVVFSLNTLHTQDGLGAAVSCVSAVLPRLRLRRVIFIQLAYVLPGHTHYVFGSVGLRHVHYNLDVRFLFFKDVTVD